MWVAHPPPKKKKKNDVEIVGDPQVSLFRSISSTNVQIQFWSKKHFCGFIQALLYTAQNATLHVATCELQTVKK